MPSIISAPAVLWSSVCDRRRGSKKRIEMKQSSPYVESDWNILAISHRAGDIIWEASGRQSSLAAGAVVSGNTVMRAQPQTNSMTQFPRASTCECYENTCPFT